MLGGSMSPAILTLVRHGETAANLEGVWHGSTDTPLTERGRAQAERVGAYIGETYPESSALYASPRTRTLDTAAPIAQALGLEVQVEPGPRPRPGSGSRKNRGRAKRGPKILVYIYIYIYIYLSSLA